MLKGISVKLAASDIDRARHWYEEKLGLSPYEDSPAVLRYRVGSTSFSLYLTPTAGSAKNTVAVWSVDDLRGEVARMRTRGVVFEDYDFGDGDKTIDGVIEAEGTLNAWFTDSEGNTMALAEELASTST